MHTFALTALLTAVAATALGRVPSDLEQRIVFVTPEKEVRGVPISVREPTLVGIAPGQLDPHSTYEVTLSYPATTPSVYTVKFVTEDETEYFRRTAAARTLLNVHQFLFSLEGDRPPVVKLGSGAEVLLLAVSVTPEGKTPVGAENDPEEFAVSTNIFLSRHVGGVPLRAVPVLLYAFGIGVAVVIFGLCVFPRMKLYTTMFESKAKRDQSHEL